jgi:hypothetical protein
MQKAKGKTMTPDKDDLEEVYFLKQLISDGRLEGAALGIAKQAVDKGPDTLSPLQSDTLSNAIRQFSSEKCESCHGTIPWPERFQAIDSGRCLACIVK